MVSDQNTEPLKLLEVVQTHGRVNFYAARGAVYSRAASGGGGGGVQPGQEQAGQLAL